MFKKKKDLSRIIPERFRVARSTLLFDRLMTGVIISGGLMVIVSVLGIFLFILAETLPLFGGATVKETAELRSNGLGEAEPIPDFTEDWVFLRSDESRCYFFHNRSHKVAVLPVRLPAGETITASAYLPEEQKIVIGTDKGNVSAMTFEEAKEGKGAFHALPSSGSSVVEVRCGGGKENEILLAVCRSENTSGVFLLNMGEKVRSMDLGEELSSPPVRASLSREGHRAVVLTEDNNVHYFAYDDDDEEWIKEQTFTASFGPVALAEWVFGDNSVVLGGVNGNIELWSIYPQRNEKGKKVHLFGKTKEFPSLKGEIKFFAASSLNRSFLIGSERELSLCYSTTGDVRWKESNLGFVPKSLGADGELSEIVLTDAEGGVQQYSIEDRHPEVCTSALFRKVWYEGYPEPAWQWQSVGGSDDYEAKLSLMPLIFGTFKGTLYSLLFAIPVALLAAVYTSHFMAPEVKRIVKPVMEIMASLPSVVLGFLGALYLAPLMEDKVPALICLFILVPAATVGLGMFWASRPVSFRNKFRKGCEYLVLIPPVILLSWFCWSWLGDFMEPLIVRTALAFTGGAGDGHVIQTFPDLWRNGFGLPYEQRNSLVVGLVMGFAVIPVIFTIAEDALSNVPASLVNASEALGASRWQVVKTIVFPVAAAGIFSALMIGFGRAVGETMIVLMATGNTPVMEWDIFNGMRTLSANIATELPEAAEHSTHYRVLFLCGFILFLMTFVLNTVAEIMRQRLREKFKVV